MTASPLARLPLLILALVSLGAAPKPLPPVSAIANAEADLLPELVVRARTPGPAWWRVTSGATTVWVLGVPAALPRGLKWDASVLQRRIAKTGRLILPPTASFGVLDVFGAFSLSAKLKNPGPFEPTLPPPLAAHYLADAALLRQSAGHYDRWKPAVAGLIMVGDFRKQAGLDGNQPVDTIKGVAGRAGVPGQPAATYPALPMARTLAGELSPAVNLACLADSLQEIESGPGRVRAAAQAWAIGDVPGALTAERGFERCLAALPNGADIARRTTDDQVQAIVRALRTPNGAVAVVELRSLVSQGGVLDRLRAAGYGVKTPGED